MKKLLLFILLLSLTLAMFAGCQTSQTGDFRGSDKDIEAEETPEAKADKLREFGLMAIKQYNAQDTEATVSIDLPVASGRISGITRSFLSIRSATESASICSDSSITLNMNGTMQTNNNSQEIYYTDGRLYITSTAGNDTLPSLSCEMGYEEFFKSIVIDDVPGCDAPLSSECEKVYVNKLTKGGWRVEYIGVMGSTARSYLSLMASLSSLASIKSFHGVDITITYNDRFEPTETVSKLINTVSGSTRYAIADAHSVSSFFSIDGEAPGTAVIARDSYTEVKDLPLAARLGQKINKMFFGDEGTVNLNMTTDLGTSSGNKDITYALVINDICKGEFELTERDKNNKPYLYVYEDGELSRGTGNPDGTASFDGEAKVETNISVAFQNIKAITDPLTFNLNFVSKIEEEYSRYTVYLDNSALAQVGLNYTEDYKGSTISYSFNVTNGEITNLTALVEIYYQDEFLMSIEYRYSFGIDPDAPPLTR